MQAQRTPTRIQNATGTSAAPVPDAADRKSTTDELAASGLANDAIPPQQHEVINGEKRLLLRHELDTCLSLLDVAVHALRCEHEFQQHQRRPAGLPHLNAVIKTLRVCSSTLEACWSELSLAGDVDHEYALWRPESSHKLD